MKDHIIHLLNYNDTANQKLLAAILTMPDSAGAMRLFSHLISAQDKWMNRITRLRPDSEYSQFGPVYTSDTIGQEWERSIAAWKDFAQNATQHDLDNYLYFQRHADGKHMKVKMLDLLLQINYHSMHHRAQINTMLSAQGVPVPLTDYIYGALSEVDTQ